MKHLPLIRRFIKEEKGAVAVLAAVMVTALVGLAGAAVDLGMLYSTHGELQNAADAAALAAAATLVGVDGQGSPVTQPDLAVSTAQQYVAAHQAGATALSLLGEDMTMGFWDFEAGDFDPDRIGPSGAPSDLTAVRVTVRRDHVSGNPVSTYFAKILGVDDVDLAATGVAYVGYPGSVDEGVVDLPIAVHEDALASGGDVYCGADLEFHSENDETASWTTFFTWPTNDRNVDKFIQEIYTPPALEIGDVIHGVNGNLSNNTFRDLQDRFQAEQTGGEWMVILPVIDPGGPCSCNATVVGFAHFVITGVRTAPHKDVQGYVICDMTIQGSRPGGENFGARAGSPVMIN